MSNQPQVEYARENGKWQFKGETFCLLVSGRTSRAKASKIAVQIGASLKRNSKIERGVIDGLAVSQIKKIIDTPTYKGINFSHAN